MSCVRHVRWFLLSLSFCLYWQELSKSLSR